MNDFSLKNLVKSLRIKISSDGKSVTIYGPGMAKFHQQEKKSVCRKMPKRSFKATK